MMCASKLALMLLFGNGCDGLVAVRIVQAQAYFRQTSCTTTKEVMVPVTSRPPECLQSVGFPSASISRRNAGNVDTFVDGGST